MRLREVPVDYVQEIGAVIRNYSQLEHLHKWH